MDEIIKDEVIGELKYHKNNFWVRRLDAPFLNSKGELKLVVQDDNKEGILDVQREAYKTYLQNEDKYKSCVTDLMLDYYKWNYEYVARTVKDLEECDHKDVITEKELLIMVNLQFLFICRDGSFGYAFGCCWDLENGLAVLLSESEPRVISKTQLKNLHKVNDPTLGLLVHDGKKAWKGLEINAFFGKPENLEIELEGGVEEGVTEAQRMAYATYQEKKEEHFTTLTKLLLTVYLRDPVLAEKSLNADFGIVVATALPKTLFIDREGNYGWILYTDWNKGYYGLLLSEDTPSWLYPDELRGYSSAEKVYDKVFGAMVYELSNWRKLELSRIDGSMMMVSLYLRNYGSEITDVQRSIYQDYVNNQSVFKEELKKTMLDYYKEYYDDFVDFVDDPKYADKKTVTGDMLIGLLDFTDLMIDEKGRLAWLCQIPTENSGLALQWENGKVRYMTLSEFMYG